ncbi:peptidoglycan DD-metalloendopeptidase family protein [Sneathiella sp.]|uniref:peptidoglycan DD-metalloendopeptidase family protein n=1 Tax=Sneathiella sp. TaxID=1964365 RepID=UPI0039E5F77D
MKFRPVISRIFVERQIIISSQGHLKHFKISSRAQMSAALLGFSSLALVAGLVVSHTQQSNQLAFQSNQLDLLQEKVRTVSSNLLLSRSNLQLTKTELDQQYARLEEILTERQTLESTLQTAAANLKQTAHDLDSRDQYARDLENRISLLTDKLKMTNERSENLSLEITKMNKALYHTTEERDQFAEAKLIAQKKLSSLNRELQMFQSSKDEIYNRLQSTKKRLNAFEESQRQKEAAERKLKSQIASLESRLHTISTENKELIARVHEQAVQGIDALKETITLTGLDPDDILSLDNIEGKGGPYYGLSGAKNALKAEQDYYDNAQKMELSLAKWTSLNSIMKNIPLSRPTDVGFVSSSFGMRRDPIRKKRAFHAGMDISGPKNTPIYSTAPGVVSKAGRDGAYGLMVEIDHGQGFKTRYGHLKKIYVKRGEQIEFKTKIGKMGSTGRSTGRHVHYEIRYNGKPQDPAKFFKAGNYAFQSAPKETE